MFISKEPHLAKINYFLFIHNFVTRWIKQRPKEVLVSDSCVVGPRAFLKFHMCILEPCGYWIEFL